MHVIYLCCDSGVAPFGHCGSSIHLRETLRAWGAWGATVELFSAHGSEGVPRGLSSVRFHRIKALSNRSASAVAASELVQPAQIHDEALRRLLIKRMQSASSCDLLVYERYSLWSSVGMRSARECRIPGILEVNAPLIEEQLRYRIPVDHGVAESIAREAFAAASALVAVSEEVGQHLEQYPEARRKIQVIPNGVDPTRFADDVRPTRPAPAGVFTVGFVGSFQEWHGLRVLVDAFHRLSAKNSHYRLLLAGDGPGRKELAMMVSELGISRQVVMTGVVVEDEIPGLLASCDVAVAPYPAIADFYFSPLKLYEYMAAGLPVVASDIGQIGRVIDHQVDGWLVPPGDAQALAAAIERLRQAPELRQRLGMAARAKARDHEIMVLTRGDEPGPAKRDGFTVQWVPHAQRFAAGDRLVHEWAPDVILTQLLWSDVAMQIGARHRIPVVLRVCKVPFGRDYLRQNPPQAVIAVSGFVADYLSREHGTASTVVAPIIDLAAIQSERKTREPTDYITMFNPVKQKGGKLFREIARRAPERWFGWVPGWDILARSRRKPKNPPQNACSTASFRRETL